MQKSKRTELEHKSVCVPEIKEFLNEESESEESANDATTSDYVPFDDLVRMIEQCSGIDWLTVMTVLCAERLVLKNCIKDVDD